VTSRLHHIGLAVLDLDEAVAYYERHHGLVVTSEHTSAADGVREVLLEAGGCQVQLLQPTSDESPVGRFLARRGPGLHHLAFEVDDVDEELARLAGAGAQLVDRQARAGTGGLRIAFVHPSGAMGVLTELVQRSPT